MTNRHPLKFSILAAAVLALCLPAAAPAQWGGSPDNRYPGDYRNDNGRSGRYDGRYLRDTIRDLDRLSSDFSRDLDRRLDRSRVDGTRNEDHINLDAKEFRRAVQRLKDRFDNGRNLDRTENEARTVLETAGHVQRESRRFLNDGRLSSEWSAIRQNLRTIANAYDLRWADFNYGYDRRDNPDPGGRNDRSGNHDNDWWRRLPFPR